MAKVKQDKYSQLMTLGVTMSAANAITFSEVSIGMSIFDYAAIIIHRAEYWVAPATLNQLVATTDIVYVGITGSKILTTIEKNEPSVYDLIELSTHVIGTSATGSIIVQPLVHDFTTLPGGGLIIPAQNIYVGMASSGLASAGVVQVRIWYTMQALDASDFIEIAQRLRVLSSF